jgi:hypothetical protein
VAPEQLGFWSKRYFLLAYRPVLEGALGSGRRPSLRVRWRVVMAGGKKEVKRTSDQFLMEYVADHDRKCVMYLALAFMLSGGESGRLVSRAMHALCDVYWAEFNVPCDCLWDSELGPDRPIIRVPEFWRGQG